MEPSQSPLYCIVAWGWRERARRRRSEWWNSAAARRCCKKGQKEEDGGKRRGVREPAALPLPLLIASQAEAGEAGCGINYTHSPHASRLLRPKGVPKLPQGDVRAVSGCRGSTPGPGRGRGGPPLCDNVPSRAWASRLSGYVAHRQPAAGPRPGAHASGFPPSDSRRFRLRRRA